MVYDGSENGSDGTESLINKFTSSYHIGAWVTAMVMSRFRNLEPNLEVEKVHYP